MVPEIRWRAEHGRTLPVLVWFSDAPLLCVSSAVHGGGIGERTWVLNAQVPSSYSRRDPELHLAQIARSLGLEGCGVGMLTSADVECSRSANDAGVAVSATVGLGHPILAASVADDPPGAGEVAASLAGTINIVCQLPVRLSEAALVNAVATATEAKSQALREAGFEATGTATDCVCILCSANGDAEPFGGPRSQWGSRIARAVHSVVLSGARSGGPRSWKAIGGR